MNNSTIIDAESRRKIVDINLNDLKNYFVIANAGSGKTSILVNRMVAMVEAGIDVSKICAITFTKNAAAEFLDRFQETLRKRANTPNSYIAKYPGDLDSPNDTTRANCINALKNINLCFLGTIDAFCNKVLSEFPLNAGIPSSSLVIEEKEEMKLYKDIYELISRDELSPLYEKFRNFDLLNNKPQEVFSNSIKSVIDASSINLVLPEIKGSLSYKLNDIILKYENLIKEDLDILLAYEDDIPLINGKGKETNEYVDNFDEFKKTIKYLKSKWKVDNLISKINDINSKVSGIRFIEVPHTKIINFIEKKGYSIFNSSDNLISDLVDELSNIKYAYSMDFLYSASSFIKDTLKKLGKLTFTDYLLTFRDMLIKDMDNGMNIIKHIREKYSYFLIDESQDTSPFQTEVFLYLTSSTKALKVEDCKPIAGSLFILGDPKQSIYRFRGADVESYLKTRDLFDNVFDSNNEVLMLTRNFRSTVELIEYFNKTFDSKLPNYETIPTIDAGIGGMSGLFTFSDYIGVIKTMYNNPDYKVMVKVNNTNVERAPMFKDFMIITKNKTSHKEIINELNRNNIPVYVEGKIDIASSDAVKSVYAVYKYIAEKDELKSGALYNLLASPIFKMPINKIVCKSINNLPSSVKEYIDVIDTLKGEKNPVVLFEKILDTIKLFNKIDFMNMEYAYFILENLKAADKNCLITNLDDGIRFIEDYINASPERIMSLNYKPNAVYLANLHKVKGLEAPVVLLMKAGNKRGNNVTTRLDYINNESYVFKTDGHDTKFGGKYYTIETSLYDDEEKLEGLESGYEDERLKYVAVTRARSYLLINNSGSSFWASLLNDDFKEFVVDMNKNIDVKSIDSSNICKDININFNNEKSYKVQSPSKLDKEKIKSVYSDEKLITNSKSTIEGTIIHRLMEILVSSNNSMKKCDLIDSIVNDYDINKFNDKDNYINMLSTVYDVMNNGGYKQNNGKSSDLLKELKSAECHTELPFSYMDGSDIWYGNIDLLYIKDGKYYIVDYKTNYDGTGLEEKYKSQLDAYKVALKTIKGIDAETYIYHIDIK